MVDVQNQGLLLFFNVAAQPFAGIGVADVHKLPAFANFQLSRTTLRVDLRGRAPPVRGPAWPRCLKLKVSTFCGAPSDPLRRFCGQIPLGPHSLDYFLSASKKITNCLVRKYCAKYTFAARARQSQLFRTKVVREVHFCKSENKIVLAAEHCRVGVSELAQRTCSESLPRELE